MKLYPSVGVLILLSALLGSCGSGETSVGIDGTGNDTTIVSYGRLRSFGSVEVNGVHYDTATARFLVDGAVGSQADIGLGDIVFVEGRIEPGSTRGIAQKVMSDRVLQGRIDSLDASGGLLVALGQTVLIDSETQFDPSVIGGLQGLSIGDAVSVSGFRDVRGDIVATRITRQTGSVVAYKTTGALTNMDVATRLLAINDLVVDYSNATLLPSGAAGELATGVFVEVKVAPQETSSTVTATSVEIRRQRVQGSVGSRADVEGYVTTAGASSAQTFDIDGLPVVTTGSTDFSGTVSTDKRVMVSGSIAPSGAVVVSNFNGHNQAPVAANASVTTLEDTPLTGTLPAATDPDGDDVTYGSYSGPDHGSVHIDLNGTYTYTPLTNFFGSDRFFFRVFDGRGGYRAYMVSVTVVSGGNDAPERVGAPLAVTLGEGVATIETPGSDGGSGGLAIQLDDRILVTGLCDGCPIVRRFLADGTPDIAFGDGTGVVRIGGMHGANGVAVGPDGKIFIAGVAGAEVVPGYPDYNAVFVVARLNADGSTHGALIKTELSPGHEEATGVAQLPDGRILASGGRLTFGNDNRFNGWERVLVRYNPDGSIDQTFGGGDGFITAAETASFASLPDGRILVADRKSDSHPVAVLRVGSSRVDLQACKLEYSIVSPK